MEKRKNSPGFTTLFPGGARVGSYIKGLAIKFLTQQGNCKGVEVAIVIRVSRKFSSPARIFSSSDAIPYNRIGKKRDTGKEFPVSTTLNIRMTTSSGGWV